MTLGEVVLTLGEVVLTLGKVVSSLVFWATSPLHRIDLASSGLRLSFIDHVFDCTRLVQFLAAFFLGLRVFFHGWDSTVECLVSFMAVHGFVGVRGLHGFVGVGGLQGFVGVGGRRTWRRWLFSHAGWVGGDWTS